MNTTAVGVFAGNSGDTAHTATIDYFLDSTTLGAQGTTTDPASTTNDVQPARLSSGDFPYLDRITDEIKAVDDKMLRLRPSLR